MAGYRAGNLAGFCTGIDTSGDNNRLYRSTSSRAYKKDIESLDKDYSKALLDAKPVWYRSKVPDDNPKWSFYGFVAEDIAEIDPRMVHWGYHPDDYEEYDKLVSPAVEAQSEVRDENGELVSKARPARQAIYLKDKRLKEGVTPKPDGVMYERFTAHHHLLITELFEQTRDLMGRVKSLEELDPFTG